MNILRFSPLAILGFSAVLIATPAAAQSSAGKRKDVLQQERIRTTRGVQPTQRIDNRIRNRVDLRLRSRIDPTHAPQVDPSSAVARAQGSVTKSAPPPSARARPNEPVP